MNALLRYALVSLLALFGYGVGAQNSESSQYMHIADMSLLADGDEVIIVSGDASAAMSKYQDAKKEYVQPCSVTLNPTDGTATIDNDSVAIFKLEKLSNGWRLYNDANGWLSTKANPVSSLTFSTKKSDARNLVNLTFLADGNASFEFKGIANSENKYLDFRAQNRRFARYNRPDYYQKVQVYRRMKSAVVVENLTLGEEGGNADLINRYNDAFVRNVTIDRTFRADGGYYTLCLPFNLTEEDIKTAFPGMLFKQFKSLTETTDCITYHFLSVNATVAGEPYLVKMMPNATTDVVRPQLKDKLIVAVDAKSLKSSVDAGTFKFVGTYDPVLIPADGCYRFVSADGNTLVTPNKDGNLKGLRAYFVMSDLFENINFDSNAKPKNVAIVMDEAE